MPHRRKDPPIASWTIPAATWAAFVAQVEAEAAEPGAPGLSLRRRHASAGDVEVALFEDAAWVGEDELALVYLDEWEVALRQDRLAFADRLDAPAWIFPVPLPDAESAALARRWLDHQAAENERERLARAAPTWRNRLLDWVEGHFVLAMLLFFFVLLPGATFAIAWVVGT